MTTRLLFSTFLLVSLAFAFGSSGAQAQTKGDVIGDLIKDVAVPRKKPLRVVGGAVAAKKLFGAKKDAAKLKPHSYGFYTKGCLAGAEQLEPTGPAWQAMRLSRNRNWGHPKMVALVRRLAAEAKEHDGWNGLLVGDLSQPRGGPMLSGHRSHQIGLDADVWLNPMPNRELTYNEREKISAKSMVLDRKRLNRKRWTEAHAKVLYRAANYNEVERIFVHPPIKKEMCEWATRKGFKNRGWLGKIRAYYGHHYHFHIRIRCPKGTVGCKDQKLAPRQDDCKANLAYWMGSKPWKKPGKPKKKPKKKYKRFVMQLKHLPKACRTVLNAD
ncbi:MAG: penicillin-insensitive murein endopeptidase [Alphaproteobacteria bacterium]|nr:penicillin-insensitive murein endopeptidase [Alphaproteobacteria bacterium]